MARLTSPGIVFGDSTVANSRADLFAPAGTVCLFFRSTAPTFWTQVTTHNDKALRLINGTGGGSGGVNTFTSTFAIRSASATVPVSINGLAVQPTTIDFNTMAVHAHPANNAGNTGSGTPAPSRGTVTVVAPGGSTGNNGGGGAHNHPAVFTSASGPWTASIDVRIQYTDVILCSFNG